MPNKQHLNHIQGEFLRKFEGYEQVYQSKLKAFQSVNIRDSSIWSNKITAEDERMHIGSAMDYIEKSPSEERKVALIEALRAVTEGKIFLELESLKG